MENTQVVILVLEASWELSATDYDSWQDTRPGHYHCHYTRERDRYCSRQRMTIMLWAEPSEMLAPRRRQLWSNKRSGLHQTQTIPTVIGAPFNIPATQIIQRRRKWIIGIADGTSSAQSSLSSLMFAVFSTISRYFYWPGPGLGLVLWRKLK